MGGSITPHVRRSSLRGAPARDPRWLREFVEALTDRLREGLRSRYADEDRKPEAIGSPESLAQRMLDVVPETSAWDELLGPFYTTDKIRRILGGISRQAVADRRKRGTLLALETEDGVLVYPVFQFDRHFEVLPGLADIVRVLRDSGVDDWTLAGWLVAPLGALGGRSVIDCLRRAPGEPETGALLVLARDAARRFRQ